MFRVCVRTRARARVCVFKKKSDCRIMLELEESPLCNLNVITKLGKNHRQLLKPLRCLINFKEKKMILYNSRPDSHHTNQVINLGSIYSVTTSYYASRDVI